MADVAAPAAVADLAEVPFGERSIEIHDVAVGIDVEEIMARIRRSITEKKKTRLHRHDAFLAQGADLLRVGDSAKNLRTRLGLLAQAARIDPEGEPISSHRPLLGPAIKWVKRVTRFWIRKYTDGLLAGQNRFNADVVSALTELHEQLQTTRAENERLRRQLERGAGY
jgi:hypothetical protein